MKKSTNYRSFRHKALLSFMIWLISLQTVFASELDHVLSGVEFYFQLALLLIFALIVPFLFFIKTKLRLKIFSAINWSVFAWIASLLLPDLGGVVLFLAVFFGLLQLIAIIVFYKRKKTEIGEEA